MLRVSNNLVERPGPDWPTVHQGVIAGKAAVNGRPIESNALATAGCRRSRDGEARS
jgi:hypothetical protein